MPWQTQSKEDWYKDYVDTVLETPYPILPKKSFKVGRTIVSWFESEPGIAVIRSRIGNCDERSFAEWICKQQLEAYGLKRAQFTFDHDFNERVASWDDIQEKAKRLIDSGNVQVLRNGYNNIVGTVIGDHGTYDTEIGRDDPNSRAITTWTCTCPWDQYAWQRTRQWKKYEGRCCSHVLALYWQAQSMPLDEDISPTNQQQQLFDPEQAGPSTPSIPQTAPAAPQGQQLQIPGINPGMAQGTAPMAPGAVPGQPGTPVLPPFPMAEKPPPPVSVPGGKSPSPYNPIQYPGGTFSSWKFAGEDPLFDQSQWGNLQVRLNKPHYGIMQGKSELHGAGQYKEIPAGSIGTLMEAVDDLGGQANVIFAGPQAQAGELQPYHVQAWIPLKDLTPMPGIQPPGPFIKRRTNAWVI